MNKEENMTDVIRVETEKQCKTSKSIWKDWHYTLMAFIFSAVAVMVPFSMANRMFFSQYSIMEGDYFCQEVPFYIEVLRKMFQDTGNFWYSFNYSMGSDIFAQYDIFSCFNPFILLYFIPNANVASILMVIGKLATAGCFFQIFCRKCLKKNGPISVVFSVAYALCGYNTMFYINIAFLEGVYMLPIVFFMLYRLVEKRKWIGLSLAYSYIFINCFYAGYIVGFFSFFAFILYLIFVFEGEKKEKAKRFGLFILSVLIAVLFSCFIILPTAVYVISNMAEDATVFEGLKLNLIDILGNLFLGMNQGRMGVIPYLYCGIIVMFTTPCFFVAKDIHRKYKLFCGLLLSILLLCSLVDSCYLFMHCFDAPDTSGFRFSYMISFLLLSMGITVFETCRTSMKKIILIIISVVCLIILVITYFLQQYTWEQEYQSMSVFIMELNLIIMLVYSCYLLLQKKFKTRWGSIGFFSIFYYCELIFNTYLVLIINSYEPIEYLDSYQIMMDQNQQVFDELSEIEKGEFYRVSMEQSPSPNYLMMFNQKGLASFSSFENVLLRDTLTKLGYATSTRLVYDYGGTDFTKMIFSQKYNIVSYCVTYNNLVAQPYYTVQDKNLGLGFLCNPAVYDVELTDNAVRNQNRLLAALSGIEEPLYRNVESQIECELQNVVYGYSDELGSNAYVLNEDCEQGEVRYTFDGEDTTQFYCYLPYELNGKYVNFPIIYSEGGDVGYSLTSSFTSMPHMLKIGKDTSGEYNVNLAIDNTMMINYIPVEDIYFVYQDDAVLEHAHDVLSKHQLQIDKWKDGYIKGNISVDDEKNVLFLSIPFEKGWKAYVDGKETKITPVVNDTFISIDLSEGEHEVELVYTNTYGVIGKWISLISFAGLVVYECYRRRKIMKSKKHHL